MFFGKFSCRNNRYGSEEVYPIRKAMMTGYFTGYARFFLLLNRSKIQNEMDS